MDNLTPPTPPTQPPAPLAGGTAVPEPTPKCPICLAAGIERNPSTAPAEVAAGCKEGRSVSPAVYLPTPPDLEIGEKGGGLPLPSDPAARAAVSPATGEREAELRGLITDVLAVTPKITSTFSFEEFGALTNGLVFVLTPLLDRREGELSQQWRLSSVCREKEAELAALRTLVAKLRADLTYCPRLLEEVIEKQKAGGHATKYQEAFVAQIRKTLALTPAVIADELAAKDARIRELEGHHQRDEELLVQRTAVLTAAQSALREAEAVRGEGKERLLNVARGCHDYGGGYREPREVEIFHHGIQTVINALEAFSKNPNDTQTLALERAARALEPKP